ncbi:IS4 family transposase [Paraburkholderia translucens]|nr:IS4 family transposase [Paraburkholderia sp. MMS20-SJTN17]
MLGRSAPQAAAELAFTHTEIELLEHIVHDTPHNAQAPPLVRNVIRLAQLGGYLARANDPPPGNTVMWRGMRRLTDIQIGYELALKEVGNCKNEDALTADHGFPLHVDGSASVFVA